MKIHNIRMGLATNSSSTHSIIILPKGVKQPKDNDIDGGNFGWNYFTAASKKSKRLYLASILHGSLVSIVGEDIADTVVESWVGINNKNGHIDHQSRIDLPLDWEGKAVSKEFFDEFAAYILNNRVVILGGNDNDGEDHPLYKKEIESKVNFPIEQYQSQSMVCKKDGQYWVLFNRKTGTKLRMSFDTKAPAYTKSETPELVDIKITDYCPFNCAYCYQGSTIKGEHASLSSLDVIIKALNNLKVFEVALGGGEPTLHPEFIKILKKFRENHIVPNFTTKSRGWLENDAQRTLILENAGNFAYSAETGEDVKKIAEVLEKHNLTDRAVIHYVMGVGDEQTFKDVVKECADNRLELTLLGYKTNGRGSLFQPKDNGTWLKYLMKLQKEWKCPKIGIDTKLAQVAGKELKDAGIPHEMYHTDEGKFSMYIDAVDGLIAPSSYCEKKDMKPLMLNTYHSDKVIADHFASF